MFFLKTNNNFNKRIKNKTEKIIFSLFKKD